MYRSANEDSNYQWPLKLLLTFDASGAHSKEDLHVYKANKDFLVSYTMLAQSNAKKDDKWRNEDFFHSCFLF